MAGEGFMMSANTSLKNNRRNKTSKLEKFVNTTTNDNIEFVDHVTLEEMPYQYSKVDIA